MARTALISAISLLLLCLSLFGCERNTAENSLQTYNERLANVLDVSPSQEPETDIPAFPDTRELLQPNDDIRIGLLDAYELRKCGLFNLIAERNSILGKVRDRTRQFHYELLLMDGLEHCIDTLPLGSALLPELRQSHQLKRRQLPIYLWNMFTTGEEWQRQLNIHYKTFPLDSFPGFVENLEALHYLKSIHQTIQAGETVTPKQADRLLFHQKQIHTFRYFGQLFYSIARTRDWLAATVKLLESSESRIICGANRNQQTAEYLKNVFFRFFITDIQPYLAELDSQYRQIQPSLLVLLQPPTKLTESFSAYYQNFITGALYNSFKQVTMDHVDFWQRTFDRCSFRLGTLR